MIRFVLVLPFVLLLIITGCSAGPSQSGTVDNTVTPQASNPSTSAPGIPWPPTGSPQRITSSQSYDFTGTDYSSEGGTYNAAVPGTDVFILAMDPLESAFAIYPAAVPAGERPVSLTMTVGNNDDITQPLDPPLPYWIGVSNFLHETWEFSGPYTTYSAQFNYNSSASRDTFVSAGDTTYLAIVTFDDWSTPVNRYPAIIGGSLEITGDPLNIAPEADLTVSDDVVLIGETATWDASGSNDSDGSIVDYEWDLDNDGIFNESGTDEESAQGQAQVAVEYYPPRYDVTVTVRVTDDDGSSDTASGNLRVNRTPVVLLGPIGFKAPAGQLATINVTSEDDPDGTISELVWDFNENGVFNETGDEAAAYDLRTVSFILPAAGPFTVSCRATDNDGGTSESFLGITGTGWATYHVFGASAGNHPESLDILGCSGNPLIAFVSMGELVIAVGNAEGSSWSAEPLASVGTYHAACSLALVQGNPAVAYFESDARDLYYAWSSSASGSSAAAWTHVGVDTLGWDVGQFCDLALVNGYPSIACFDATNNVAFYSYCTDDYGLENWGGYPVDGASITGIAPSLSDVNGSPVMSYGNYSGFYQKYAYTEQLQGLPVATWTTYARTSAGDSNTYAKMLNTGSYPLYCKITSDARTFKVYKGSDLAGSSWQDQNIVSFTSAAFYGKLDATMLDGLPVAAALLDPTYNEVRVWRSQTSDGMGSAWEQTGDALSINSHADSDLAITGYKGSIAVAGYDAIQQKITFSYLYE